MAKFCSNCGAELNEEQDICLKCGVRVKNTNTNNKVDSNPNAKSKMAAGLLGIFLGQFGVHNFYLGYTGKAVAQLLLTIFGYILAIFIVGIFMVAAAGIWGLVEGIMILSGSSNFISSAVKPYLFISSYHKSIFSLNRAYLFNGCSAFFS